MLRIRIRPIRIFLGLLDPDPYPLVRGTDPDPTVIKEDIKKNRCTFFYFLSLINDVNEKSYKRKSVFKNCFLVCPLDGRDENKWIRIRMHTGSQGHGSADPDLDQHQNIMRDPQHC